MSALIQVRELRKVYRVHKRAPGAWAAIRALFHRRYEAVAAVDGVSFEIEAGARVGFLGPNGAGKTTTLKILSGLLYPTAGQVRVDGHLPQAREAAFLRKIMLVMGQKQQLMWDLPPEETFELNRAIFEVPRAEYKRTVDELVELLEVGELITKPTRELSLGERMKCELIAALIHRPQVLFLDEPTIGLDVTTQVKVRDFIRAYNERHGATLILTSHYMDDVAALCPRVIVIDKGQLSYDGPLEELVRKIRPEKRVTFRFERPVEEAELAGLGAIIERQPQRAILQLDQGELAAALSRALGALPVADFTVENAPLEEVMSELFARSRASRERLLRRGREERAADEEEE